MNKRPLSVTVIGLLFLVAGTVGFAYHATEFNPHGPFQYDLALVSLVRIAAVVAAIFMLRAANWARWLLIVWIAYHVALSAFHSPGELAVHAVLMVVVAWFLFHRLASEYFRGTRPAALPANREPETK